MGVVKCIRCNEEPTSGYMWTRDVLACPECVRAVASCFPTDEEFFGMLERAEELARLRRMADAYAKMAIERADAEWDIRDQRMDYCTACRSHVFPVPFRLKEGEIGMHTATCDVAIHIGLPREKGDGE